jgi:ribosome maturation factor RimP
MADLFALTQEVLLGTDLELVDIERAPMGLLRITLDRPGGLRIEDCEMVSRQLSRVFEVENVDYQRLEVGSPGVDRPLRQEQDFLRFANERIEIRLRQPVNNRKVFSGILRTDDNAGSSSSVSFRLELEPQSKKGPAEELSFTLDDIDRAKLDPVLDFKGKKR